jgi:hypothetical protein
MGIMASSAEMLAGAMGLLVCTFVDLLLYLVGNSILGPLTKLVNEHHITPLLGMAENSYVPYILWAFLLLFELGAIMAFVYIVGRKQISGTEYL